LNYLVYGFKLKHTIEKEYEIWAVVIAVVT
jgi:hypothetical protein